MAINNTTAATDEMSSDYLDYILSNATATTDEISPDHIFLNAFYWEQIILAIRVWLIGIGGLIGNAMTIAAVSFSKKLQTSTNAFVTSLSVVDLLTAFTLIWYGVSILGKGEWPIPGAYWLCQFTGYMVYATLATSMWTLGVIAINRLICIVKPIWYNQIFTSWKLGFLVAIPWVVPTASLLVLIVERNVALGYNKHALDCRGAAAVTIDNDVFELGLLIIGLLFPLPAIVISYIWIYLFIRNHFRKQKQSFNSAATPTSSSGHSTSDLVIEEGTSDPNSAVAVRRKKRISKQEIEITKNLFFVVVGFIMFCLPYLIARQLETFQYHLHIQFYMRILPFSNCAINFVIYAAKHPDFKVVLRHMMRCSYADIPQPTPLLKYILSRRMN